MDRLVVYVDVDGVVTTDRYRALMGRDAVNPHQCAMVAELLADQDALWVVSSTWRTDDRCRAILGAAGLPLERLHPDWRTAPPPRRGTCPLTGDDLRADAPPRGDEVADHVARNGVVRYLVLDDDDSIGGAVAERLVRPDPRRGLTGADLEAARALAGA